MVGYSFGEAVFLSRPTKFRSTVLKIAHEECGNFDVRKLILKHFLLLSLKRDVSMFI